MIPEIKECCECNKRIGEVSEEFRKVYSKDNSKEGVDYLINRSEKCEDCRSWNEICEKQDLNLLKDKLLSIGSRKVLHSQNWKKQLNKNNKVHSKIANSRKDVLHKESKKYVDNYDVICFEDIDLRGFAKALKLGKPTLDNGFGMFRNFVKYKAENQGKYFIKIPKHYPSTQTCSNCGNVKDKENKLKLSDRVYHCNVCGFTKDRDINAALNIMKKGRDCLDSLLNKLLIESCS